MGVNYSGEVFIWGILMCQALMTWNFTIDIRAYVHEYVEK